MGDAAHWLAERVAGAPEQLRARMFAALQEAHHDNTADRLARAAELCLARALEDSLSRASALELLAADALFTHACEAAAEAGSSALAAFAGSWTPARLAELLPPAGP